MRALARFIRKLKMFQEVLITIAMRMKISVSPAKIGQFAEKTEKQDKRKGESVKDC